MLTTENVIGPWGGSKDLIPQRKANIATLLVPRVNKLLGLMAADKVLPKTNPATKSIVSGQTLGGFRPQGSKVGTLLSRHKEGEAVDLFDPDNALDKWCMEHLDKLAECELWLESPNSTSGWCHLQCVPPRSGVRVFNP